ncbi:hypothetical protein HELRODRAFT_70335 [Helobdella robusta]|uniref:Tektin n=1 Tax=Helobdella robusta TaxID=6412 RepID=T1G050_HELRO|nr:hypothetical protein HELRODRAFT_70335 [Helobdella robusta]ESN91809.1 hypothetical protein HELRODRAFT_70335 [Helobdella robusta]
MAGPNIEGCEPNTFLPAISAIEQSYQPFDSFPNSRPLKKAPVTLPWKASSYYGVCRAEPNWPCCDSMPQPLASTNKLRHLDGIKIPPVFAAARNALFTRYSERDWCLSNQCNYQTSNRVRCASEFLRHNSLHTASELEEKSQKSQIDSNNKLSERIQDIMFWKCELQAEMDKMLAEMDVLLKSRSCLEREISELNNTLYIDQECLYNREKRQGIEMVHDDVEVSIIQEIDLLKRVQEDMRNIMNDINQTLASVIAAYHELEKDSADKFVALNIDNNAIKMKNTSRGIYYYDCIERVDNSQSVPETWAKYTDDNIKRSMQERKASRELRNKVEEMLTITAERLVTAWNNVNSAFSDHIEELEKAKYKIQAHLSKILEEIFNTETSIELLKKSIEEKAPYMKVAQTRLEARNHRPNMENTRDHVHNKLVEEVYEVCETIDKLKAKLRESENALQQLLRTKASLQHDLDLKLLSILIDREKCMGLRRSYPLISRVICY